MATRLYLRNTTPASPPTAGEKSTALPVGTSQLVPGNAQEYALSDAKGAAQASLSGNGLAQTAHQDQWMGRFTSAGLSAQTIGAQTWTLAIASSETNVNANSYTVLSLYVWRPGTSSVVGYIRDSDTTLGVEWGQTEDGQVVTFAGSAVAGVQANDVLVLEVWKHAAQGKASLYAQAIYFNGTADVTDSTTTNAASYLEAPTLLFPSPQTVALGAPGAAAAARPVARTPAVLLYDLSGGAANADPALSYGGARSLAAQADSALFPDVDSAHCASGETRYRCVYFRLEGPGPLNSPYAWVKTSTPSADDEVDVGLDPAGKNGTAASPADDLTAPAGVTFSHPTTKAGGLALPSAPYQAGDFVAVWVRRTVNAGAGAYTPDVSAIRVEGTT